MDDTGKEPICFTLAAGDVCVDMVSFRLLGVLQGASCEVRDGASGGEFSKRGSFHSKWGVWKPEKTSEFLDTIRPRGREYFA
jgi:hypothetical protein